MWHVQPKYMYYEIDDEEVGMVLRADEYDGDEDCSWVLLEPTADAPGPSAGERSRREQGLYRPER